MGAEWIALTSAVQIWVTGVWYVEMRGCLQRNLGTGDRALRVVLAAAVVVTVLLVARQPLWWTAGGVLAGVLVDTAINGY